MDPDAAARAKEIVERLGLMKPEQWNNAVRVLTAALTQYAAEAVAGEREACAALVEQYEPVRWPNFSVTRQQVQAHIAAAIRARGSA